MTVLALTVLGDGVRTALDPRAASRLRIGTGRRREARAGTEKAGAATEKADVTTEKVTGTSEKGAGA